MINSLIEMSVAVLPVVFEEAENSSADRSRSVFRNSLSGAGVRPSTVESNEDNRFDDCTANQSFRQDVEERRFDVKQGGLLSETLKDT